MVNLHPDGMMSYIAMPKGPTTRPSYSEFFYRPETMRLAGLRSLGDGRVLGSGQQAGLGRGRPSPDRRPVARVHPRRLPAPGSGSCNRFNEEWRTRMGATASADSAQRHAGDDRRRYGSPARPPAEQYDREHHGSNAGLDCSGRAARSTRGTCPATTSPSGMTRTVCELRGHRRAGSVAALDTLTVVVCVATRRQRRRQSRRW